MKVFFFVSAMVGLIFLASTLKAEDRTLIEFQEFQSEDIINEPASTAEVSIDDGSLLMQAGHYWENVFKIQKRMPDVSEIVPGQFLKIETMLDTKDQGPVLNILIFSKDWKTKAVWAFDLSGARDGSFVIVPATTPVDKPGEGSDPDFDISQGIGGIQFATAAKHGVNPWSLRIKSIKVGGE